MAKAKKETLSLEQLLEQAIVKEEDRPYEVPRNWVWTKIKYISGVVTGTTPSKNNPEYYGEEYPFFKPTDLEQGYNVIEAREYLSELGVCKGRFIPKFSTLVTCIGATIGKCGFSRVDGSVNQQINAMIPFKAVSDKYIYWIINSPFMQDSIISNASSTTLPILNKSRFEELIVPVPPVVEQKRIVEVIESLFEKLDTAKELIQNALDSFESRKAAILHKAFTGELTARWREENGESIENWDSKKISEICSVVRGGSPRPAGDPKYYNGDIPFLKVADITRNEGPYIYTHEYSITEAGLNRTRLVEANTLLLTNSGATLGVPAICTFKTTFNDGIAAFLGLDIRSLKFFYYFWTTQTKALRAINMGAAQPNLNTDIIGNVKLNLPSIKEQQEIIRILDNLLKNEQRAKELSDVIEKIELMKKAILARAFRGELGTNNPEEESAVELLKEILKEKN